MMMLAPAFMAAFERRTHHVNVTDAFKAEIDTAVGQFNNDVLNRFFVIFRVHEIGRAHFTRQLEFLRIGINRNDTTGFCLHRSLDNRQTNATETEHRHGVALFDFRRVMHRADPVVTPQPSRQTLSSGACGFTFASEISAQTVYSLKVLVPM
jgi:hypothetical protein